MINPSPRPLSPGGRITAQRVNEIVDARIAAITGDGLIHVNRVGSSVTVALALQNLLPRIPKTKRLIKGVIVSSSVAQGQPQDVTYSVSVKEGWGDPDPVYEDKTPQIRWLEPDAAALLIAAAEGSECILEAVEGGSDYEIVVCNEHLFVEPCDPPLVAVQPPDTDLARIATDGAGAVTTDADGAVLVKPVIGADNLPFMLDTAIATDPAGRIATDAAGRVCLTAIATHANAGGIARRICTDAVGRIATDAIGRVVTTPAA